MLQNNKDISIYSINEYYPVYDTRNGMWLMYIFVGITLSLLIGKVVKGTVGVVRKV